MKGTVLRRGAHRFRQLRFFFEERSERRVRWFKRLIALSTCLAIATILLISARGRYAISSTAAASRQAVRWAIGLPKPRAEIDAAWERYRRLGIDDARRGLDQLYAEVDPPMRRLMDYAGLDPEHGLLRWGNYNLTLLLPSTVFEADDEGRSYRLRPLTHSIWIRNITLRTGVLMFFLVPDRPELADVLKETAGVPVETSRQSTNSWGLRGPEPDLDAPLRVMVLGDSYMQGMFIGDDETPTECLRRYLQRHMETDVTVLNTGVLGYSPEQYYYSLIKFAERFRPQFVLVSLFTNDFGDVYDVPTKGKGDWDEGKYWLEKIADYCRAREWGLLYVPAPFGAGMLSRRRSGNYPGLISNALEVNSLSFLDPTDAFIDAHLQTVIDGERAGHRPSGCILFNESIGDGHFSALGSRVWADRVGRRMLLLMENDRAGRIGAGASPRTPAVIRLPEVGLRLKARD